MKEHEAGYDSYMTGVCFIALARKMNVNNKDISSKSPQLRPLLNKLVFASNIEHFIEIHLKFEYIIIKCFSLRTEFS